MSALGEVARQHDDWAPRHARLVRGPAPLPKPQRPRPVSPFVLEARERRRAQRVAFERQMLNASAGIDVTPHVDHGWPAYRPIAPYDECATAPRRATITMRQIIKEVAEKHAISVTDILSCRRPRHVVLARHEAMWRCKMETTFSLPQIGRAIGNRDHTTVIHGIKMHEKRRGGGGQWLTVTCEA